MGLYDKWPWVNFHELNLNWILELIKKHDNIIEGLPDYIKNVIEQYFQGGEVDEIIRDLFFKYQLAINVKSPPKGITPAKGNGAANDGDTIQACIDYAANQGYGVVLFPYGHYLTSPLTLKNNVSLVGLDRYSTILTLEGGANKPLIISNSVDNSIIGLTLDGNAESQTEDLNGITAMSSDMLLSDLIFTSNYKHLVYVGTSGHLQMNNIVFARCVNSAAEISGVVNVQMSNTVFEEISDLAPQYLLSISADHGRYDFISRAKVPLCMKIDGNYNDIRANVQNADTAFSDTGTNNTVVCSGISAKKFFSGDVSDTFENYIAYTNGDYSLNASHYSYHGDSYTVGATDTITVDSKDLVLDSENPLTYKTPAPINEQFSSVPFKDSTGTGYDVLVKGGAGLDNLVTRSEYTGNLTLKFLSNNIEERLNYDIMQGGCLGPTGNTIIVCYAQPTNELDSEQKLVEISLEDWSIIREELLPIGHGNDLCLYQNNIYVASTGNKVYVVDYATFTLSKTFNTEYVINTVAFDSKNNVFICNRTITQPELIFDIYSPDFTYQKSNRIPCPGLDQVFGIGSDCKNGLLYVETFIPNSILIYDSTSWTPVRTLNFPLEVPYHWIGEPEFIALDDKGGAYIGCSLTPAPGAGFHERQYFYTDFAVQEAVGKNRSVEYDAPLRRMYYVVDSVNYNANRQDGSIPYPYAEIAQCLANTQGDVEIRVKNGTYKGFKTIGRTVVISGVDSSPNVNINGVLSFTSNLSLINVKITGMYQDEEYNIRANQSILNLINVTMSSESNKMYANNGSYVTMNAPIPVGVKLVMSHIYANKNVNSTFVKEQSNTTCLSNVSLFNQDPWNKQGFTLSDNIGDWGITTATLTVLDSQVVNVIKPGVNIINWQGFVNNEFSIVNITMNVVNSAVTVSRVSSKQLTLGTKGDNLENTTLATWTDWDTPVGLTITAII